MAKEAKTNAMRMLERAKVAYTSHEYPHEEGQAVDGANVARLTGQDPARVFKTLVTQRGPKLLCVCCAGAGRAGPEKGR